MNLFERIHFLIRAWRYRLDGEKFGISYLLSNDLADKTVVDIGAHRGIYSYWMHRKVGANGRVVAFEPQTELAAYLRELRTRFNLKQLEIAECGLSSQRGELTLRRPKDHWGGASYDRFKSGSREVDVIPTQVTTLDVFFADHQGPPISFIKCDVEGHEYEVFKGGEGLLTSVRPALLFECLEKTVPDCRVFSYLQTLGYDGYCFARRGLAPISEYRAVLPTMHKRAKRDFVFVPQERSRGKVSRAA